MMDDCRFWDYHSGNRFQEEQVKVQPGSLESEAGVNCMTFDQSGTRLITGEVDKTIKRKPQIKHVLANAPDFQTVPLHRLHSCRDLQGTQDARVEPIRNVNNL